MHTGPPGRTASAVVMTRPCGCDPRAGSLCQVHCHTVTAALTSHRRPAEVLPSAADFRGRAGAGGQFFPWVQTARHRRIRWVILVASVVFAAASCAGAWWWGE